MWYFYAIYPRHDMRAEHAHVTLVEDDVQQFMPTATVYMLHLHDAPKDLLELVVCPSPNRFSFLFGLQDLSFPAHSEKDCAWWRERLNPPVRLIRHVGCGCLATPWQYVIYNEKNNNDLLTKNRYLSPVYSDTTQLNSTASCQSADDASAVLNVVTQFKFVGHDVMYGAK